MSNVSLWVTFVIGVLLAGCSVQNLPVPDGEFGICREAAGLTKVTLQTVDHGCQDLTLPAFDLGAGGGRAPAGCDGDGMTTDCENHVLMFHWSCAGVSTTADIQMSEDWTTGEGTLIQVSKGIECHYHAHAVHQIN